MTLTKLNNSARIGKGQAPMIDHFLLAIEWVGSGRQCGVE